MTRYARECLWDLLLAFLTNLYIQGDFNHWVALFNYFDDVLEEAVKDRPELSLSDSTPQQQPAGPFPVEACLAVLRTTATILEHCSNKHLYQSYDVSADT